MRYQMVSGALFTVIALAQLTRAVMRLPVQVGTVSIPVSASLVAFVVTGSLAMWAFATARQSA